jgi:cellulose biosynthesis protein BcsQ
MMAWQDHQPDKAEILLAGPKARTDVWQKAFSQDARFQITTIANTPSDLLVKLGTGGVDAILLDASFFQTPDSFLNAVSQFEAMTYIILPRLDQEEVQSLKGVLRQRPQVKGVYSVDVTLHDLIERMYTDINAARSQGARTSWGRNGGGSDGHRPVTARIIAVWNFAGGVGKSTIAANLAALSARRGYDTLLVSTSAPDTIPITLGLQPTPNLSDWQSNPTADGLRLLTQKVGSVDVVVGCPDVFSAGRALGIDGAKPGSFKAMMSTAIRDYPVVVVDTPPDAGAATALSTANHLVLVAEPTYPVAMCTVEAYRTVFERMAGMHSLSKANTYLLLNRAASHRVEPGRWHRQTAEHVKGSFLPLIATVPTLPEVGQAQDDSVFPIDRSEPFRRALMPLADALFADTGQRKAKGRVKNVLGIKVRY